MKRKRGRGIGLFGIVLVASSGIFMGARLDVFKDYSPLDKEFYLSLSQIAFVRPGLDLEILDVRIPADRRPVVKFSIKDPRGLPLEREGVFTPGPVSATFLIARIPSGQTQYVNYRSRAVTSPITGQTAEQATTDSGGIFAKVDEGVYTYQFGSPLPEDYDRNATHTVGVYASRDLSEFELDVYVDNAVFHFVPSGAPVTDVREVVKTENCNQCHNPLAMHGGSRREVGLCILCHQPQTTDPDTGNTVDFKVMIHKIHMGEHLPSVQAGTPYEIIGYRQSVHDFSDVAFPRDIRNCETCHSGTSQAAAYLLRPSRAACGSCHDDLNFATGQNHPGGPQVSDRQCSSCHFPEGELEFDASIRGAHTVAYKSKQLKGIQINIMDVSNAIPGQSPTVFFELSENDGKAIAPSELASLTLNLAGPTTDYSTLIRESARDAVMPLGGGYTYTFQGKIPEGAQGTFAVGAEANRTVQLNAGMTNERNYRETAENPVYYFSIDGTEPAPRRAVVSDEKCERCHENLAMHGGNRHNASEYCQMCHIPGGTDEGVRPQSDWPPQSRHFKFLIHRIHRGDHLTREFTIYGFRSSVHNYNELRFPGDLRDCETCHVNDSYTIPLPEGALATEAPREYFNPIQPVAAACIGCHDSEATAAHAYTMTTTFGEACAACHGRGRQFAVERVHAR